MKIVGIVTCFDEYNLGNRLQNYALNYYISHVFDCKVETIFSISKKKPNMYAISRKYIAALLAQMSSKVRKEMRGRQSRYLKVREWNKKIPIRYFYECDRIPQIVDAEYDIFLAGSDQIWNYMFSSKKFYDYFLEFASSGKKNSVAASIGNNEIPDEWKEYYTSQLSSFSNISVREEEGAGIIKSLLNIDVPVLIDPTMALTKEEWHAVEKKPRLKIKKPYILTYILSHELNPTDKKIVEKYKNDNSFDFYEIIGPSYSYMEGVGPAEFLYLIENADLLITDSFHGAVFSILFHTPFIVLDRKEFKMESRINTLLKNMDLLNRKGINNCDSVFECDFSKADDRLDVERIRFKEYLNNVLNSKD